MFTKPAICFVLAMFTAHHFLSDLGFDPNDSIYTTGGIKGVGANSCPAFSCNVDQSMNDTNTCFKHSGNDPVTEIKIFKCENSSEKCFVPDMKFAWI